VFNFLLLGVFFINIGIHYWNKKNLLMNSISIPQVLLMNNFAEEFCKYEYLKHINPELDTSLNALSKMRK